MNPSPSPTRGGDRTPGDPLDVVIVGAGPVGLACAVQARRAGLEYLVLEKGCLVNSIYRFPANMTFFTTQDLLEIGDHPLTSPHAKPTRHEVLQYYRSVARVEGLRVRTREKVKEITGRSDAFAVDSEGRDGAATCGARRVIIATGYYDNPNLLGVPGEDLPHASHYYGEAHPFAGERVVVVGGRNSAVEAALDLWRHGAQVTLVHRGSGLGEGVKYWLRPDIENRIAEGAIRALFRHRVVEIRRRSVILAPAGAGGDGRREEPCDQVFLLTGYHPDTGFLARCGLRPDPETLRVSLDPETLESRDVPGIYLAGSVGAGRETGAVFIENGRLDAQRIVARLARELGSRPVPDRQRPSTPPGAGGSAAAR